jgi:hypothetical protein
MYYLGLQPVSLLHLWHSLQKIKELKDEKRTDIIEMEEKKIEEAYTILTGAFSIKTVYNKLKSSL